MFTVVYGTILCVILYMTKFTTDYGKILEKIDTIDPITYGKTRNYLNGAVTKLSPYISRGIISTKQIASHVLSKGYKPYEIDSFLKELAWRDYFQQTWIALENNINNDIKQIQPDFHNKFIPSKIVNAQTGIEALDNGINELMSTGYMHNHLRMYVVSLACNIAKSHWKLPAKWMYYYLLDADWASNSLSWQWVAGSFSSKKYFANQENINKYCLTNQTNTLLDLNYSQLENIEIPKDYQQFNELDLVTNLPTSEKLTLVANAPIFIYNFYNLDVNWCKQHLANKILLLEPSFFNQYPVCEKTIDFVLNLSNNIKGIQIYVGEFQDLYSENTAAEFHFKEHPTNKHYIGIEHSRDWIFEKVTGYFPSFFAYWKKCQKYL